MKSNTAAATFAALSAMSLRLAGIKRISHKKISQETPGHCHRPAVAFALLLASSCPAFAQTGTLTTASQSDTVTNSLNLSDCSTACYPQPFITETDSAFTRQPFNPALGMLLSTVFTVSLSASTSYNLYIPGGGGSQNQPVFGVGGL